MNLFIYNKMIETCVTAVLGLASFIWAICQYLDARRREQNLKEFENYHKLIKELVQPDSENSPVMYVDRQAAIIYELRHFKRYFPFSLRTLKGLKEKWGKVDNQYPRLLDELDLTINFLQMKVDERD